MGSSTFYIMSIEDYHEPWRYHAILPRAVHDSSAAAADRSREDVVNTLQRCFCGCRSFFSVVQSASLSDICNTAYVQSKLPAADFNPGITINASSVSTNLTLSYTAKFEWYPNTTIEYLNVTFAYSHDGITGDEVLVTCCHPTSSSFCFPYISHTTPRLTGYYTKRLIIRPVSSYVPSPALTYASYAQLGQ